MNVNLILIGAGMVAVGYLSQKIELSGDLARLTGIVSKLLKTIGLLVIIAGFANP